MISNATAYDIILRATRASGLVGLGDTIDPLVSQEALFLLNAMRAEWSLNVKNYRKYDQLYTATSNKQSITLGPLGDITLRPNDITSVTVIVGDPSAQSNNFPLPIFPRTQYFENTVQKVYALPTAAYIDNEAPLLNVFFYPGLAAGYSVRVQGTSYMTDYESVSDPFMDPPEWFNPQYLNLALRLCTMYNAAAPSGLVEQAHGALKHIKAHMLAISLANMPAQGVTGNDAGAVNFISGL